MSHFRVKLQQPLEGVNTGVSISGFWSISGFCSRIFQLVQLQARIPFIVKIWFFSFFLRLLHSEYSPWDRKGEIPVLGQEIRSNQRFRTFLSPFPCCLWHLSALILHPLLFFLPCSSSRARGAIILIPNASERLGFRSVSRWPFQHSVFWLSGDLFPAGRLGRAQGGQAEQTAEQSSTKPPRSANRGTRPNICRCLLSTREREQQLGDRSLWKERGNYEDWGFDLYREIKVTKDKRLD